jgi:hypothetical protein
VLLWWRSCWNVRRGSKVVELRDKRPLSLPIYPTSFFEFWQQDLQTGKMDPQSTLIKYKLQDCQYTPTAPYHH